MIHRLTIDAFAATAAGAGAFAGLADQPPLARCRVRALDGGLDAALSAYAGHATPQVVVVEVEEGGDALLARLDRLADVCEANTRVVVVGAANDISLYRALLARGVSDYLPLPLGPAQVAAAVAALYADPQAAPRGKVVAFWGVRGGAGASTLAQNAAWCVGRALRRSVIYVDLDVSFGTSGLAFDLETRQSVADVLANPDRMDPVMLERCLQEYDEFLRVLVAPGDPRVTVRLDVDGVDRLLDMASRLAPMVVVDLPRQWGEWMAHVLAAADEVVLVALPDLTSLRDCKTLLEVLGVRRPPGSVAKLVLNRTDAHQPQLSAKVFADTLGLAPALSIAADPQGFGVAANDGRMVPESAPAGRAAQSLHQLAALLSGAKAAPAGNGFRHRLHRWLKR